MKIMLASDGADHSTESAIEFCPTSKNTYAGVVKLKLPLQSIDTATFPEVDVKVSMTADSTTNSKGRTRILFKAAIPYTALTKVPGAGEQAENWDVDPKRSGGEVSVHTVISVPKAFREDILGKSGSAQSSSSAAQLAFVGQLVTAFTKLIQPLGLTAGTQRAAYVYDMVADEFAYQEIPGSGYVPTACFGCLPDGDYVAGDTTVMYSGLKSKDNATILNGVYLGQMTKAPIVRALNGLAPVCADEQYRTACLRASTT